MNICLVNPHLVSGKLYEEWDLSEVDSISPPLGLLFLAAAIRKSGHNVSFIDALAYNLSVRDTVNKILKSSPDVVGLTATTPTIPGAADIAKALKAQHPEIKIIIGGPHVTAIPEETFQVIPHFDIGVIGEGEATIVDLLESLSKNNETLRDVRGIIYRENEKVVFTEKRPLIEDLDSIPMIAWDLLPSITNPYRMSIVGTISDKSTALVTSRGCPGRCTFCDTKVYGMRYRWHSAENVAKMVEYLIEHHGIKDFLIYDSNFVANRKRLIDICNIFIKENYNITWSCSARVNMVKPETLKLMKKAGCWQIAYGIESGSPQILEVMKKNITLEQVKQTLKWTKEAGILSRGNFIFGYIGETKETLQESLDFLLDIDLDYFQQAFLTPFPGSEVSQGISEYGEVVTSDWGKMNNVDISFIPHGLSKEEMVKFSKKAFIKFYLRPKVIWTHLKLIIKYPMIRRYSKTFSAFLKTLAR